MYLSACHYKNEWELFLPSSMKEVIVKRKMKNHFHEIFVVVSFDTHSYRELTICAKAYLLEPIK